jgi:hypothetical protein
MENEPSRVAAIGKAAGAIPVVRDRLRENDLANTQCIYAMHSCNRQHDRAALGVGMVGGLLQDGPGGIRRTAGDLVGPQGRFAILRTIVAGGAS